MDKAQAGDKLRGSPASFRKRARETKLSRDDSFS